MQKIDKIVLKETKYIAVWVLIFSVLMQAVFLVIGQWDYTVLLGNLLSGTAVVLNFFAMACTVQKALEKDPKDAKATLQLSKSGRMLALFIVTLISVILECFHLFAVIIPLIFPRIAIAIRPLWNKNTEGNEQL
jgi:uncharacterized membrane protein